jgi:hypothetical protein
MVGLSGFWTGTQLWCGNYIEADHVVVDTTLRSLGVGARLVAWIEAEGERIGCAVFRVAMVLGKERTHQFYARNGFFDDGLLMVKALSRGAAQFPEYVSPSAESRPRGLPQLAPILRGTPRHKHLDRLWPDSSTPARGIFGNLERKWSNAMREEQYTNVGILSLSLLQYFL